MTDTPATPDPQPTRKAMEAAKDWMQNSGRGEPYIRRLAEMFDRFAAQPSTKLAPSETSVEAATLAYLKSRAAREERMGQTHSTEPVLYEDMHAALYAAAQHSTAAPVSGDAREASSLVERLNQRESRSHAIEMVEAALTAAEGTARREERERIQEQGWCYQHQCYHRSYICEHDHGVKPTCENLPEPSCPRAG